MQGGEQIARQIARFFSMNLTHEPLPFSMYTPLAIRMNLTLCGERIDEICITCKLHVLYKYNIKYFMCFEM